MREIYINFNEDISNKQIATIVLLNACGKVLANKDSYPPDIFNIAYRYLFTGCKNRSEYEYLVNFLIDNPYTREELLKMTNNVLETSLALIRLKYGRKVTLEKCKEELEELIQAINKNDFENVHEEIADVYNILIHIKSYYNISEEEIKERQIYKVKRQLLRMKREK